MAEDLKLADARKRVARAERKALDRALALRDEAEQLLASARTQAARIRDDAKAEAVRLREEAKTAQATADATTSSESDDVERTALGAVQQELEAARADLNAARTERDDARGEVATAREEAKAARAERDRARTLADEKTQEWAATATLRTELNEARQRVDQLEATIGELLAAMSPADETPAATAPPSGEGAKDDLLALVALVESVEAERDALAAELAALKGDSATPPA